LPDASGPKISAMRPRDAADAEREVERQGAGGDGFDPDLGALVPHPHDRALAELALDLGQRALQGGVPGLGGAGLVGHAGRLLL
jgi:hypothetical protein